MNQELNINAAFCAIDGQKKINKLKKVKGAIIASCWWLVAAVGAETPHRDPIRAIIEN